MRQDQDKRYARQIMVPQVGPEGQALLSTKRVLIAGAGGLGTPCAAYLAGAGIGHIAVLDNDVVSLSNLPRQILYTMHDIGKEKAKVLAEKLAAANDGVSIVSMVQSITQENVSNTIESFDVVISCVDNLETRYVLNQACLSSGIPMIEGAISGFTGMVTTILPGQGPCYQCIFPKKLVPVQESIGVLGPTPGVTGSIQAAEALKLLLGKGLLLIGRLLLLDLLSGDFRIVTVKNDPYCPICGKNTESQPGDPYKNR